MDHSSEDPLRSPGLWLGDVLSAIAIFFCVFFKSINRLKRYLDLSMIDGCLSCRVVNVDRSIFQKGGGDLQGDMLAFISQVSAGAYPAYRTVLFRVFRCRNLMFSNRRKRKKVFFISQ